MLDNKAHWVRLSKYTPYYKRFTTWFSYNDDGTEFKRKSSDQCQGTLIDSKTLVTAASCATYKYYKWGNNGYNANDDLLVDDGWHAYEYQVSFKDKESFKTIHLNRLQLATTDESSFHTTRVTMASNTRQLPTTLVKNRIWNFMFIQKLTWLF